MISSYYSYKKKKHISVLETRVVLNMTAAEVVETQSELKRFDALMRNHTVCLLLEGT